MQPSYAEQLRPHLDSALHPEIRRRYAHTYGPLTGLAEIVQLMGGLPPPQLCWARDTRGRDAVVIPIIVGRIGENRLGDRSIARAYDVVDRLVPLRVARYRHQTAGGMRREARDRREAESALARAIPIWIDMALDALMEVLAGELWEITCRWTVPPRPYLCRNLSAARIEADGPICPSGIDPQVPYRAARPITATAHAIVLAERREAEDYVRWIRPRLLAVTADDVIRHRGLADATAAVARSGYLPAIAGIDTGTRWTPRGVHAMIEADPEIEGHRRALSSSLQARWEVARETARPVEKPRES